MQQLLDLVTSFSNINQHLLFLAGLATGKNVVEFGCEKGRSTAAILTTCRTLVSYDILPWEETVERLRWNTKWTFVQQSSLEIAPVLCDVLFIDSDHKKEHLAAELARHHYGVRDAIAMHDTHCHKFPDLYGAVDEFLTRHPEWVVAADFTHCNGLTVLVRA